MNNLPFGDENLTPVTPIMGSVSNTAEGVVALEDVASSASFQHLQLDSRGAPIHQVHDYRRGHWGRDNGMPAVRLTNQVNGGYPIGPNFGQNIDSENSFTLESLDGFVPGTLPNGVNPSDTYPLQYHRDWFGRLGWGVWNMPPMIPYPQFTSHYPLGMHPDFDMEESVASQPKPKKRNGKASTKLTLKQAQKTLNKKKKSVNAFMAYRAYHQAFVFGEHQSGISGRIRQIWFDETLPVRKMWAEIARLYSAKRDENDAYGIQGDLKLYLEELVGSFGMALPKVDESAATDEDFTENI